MSLNDIQKQVDDWAKQFDPPYWPALQQMARLTEEVGELAREMNHLHGLKKKKDSEKAAKLSEELIDVIFTVCCMANSEGIDLQQEWDRVMKEKHWGRDNKRYKKISKEGST